MRSPFYHRTYTKIILGGGGMAIVVKFEIMDNYFGLTLSRQKLNKRRLIANIDCELFAESQNLQKN